MMAEPQRLQLGASRQKSRSLKGRGLGWVAFRITAMPASGEPTPDPSLSGRGDDDGSWWPPLQTADRSKI